MVCFLHGRGVLRTVYRGTSFLPSRPISSVKIDQRGLTRRSLDTKSVPSSSSGVKSELLDMSDAVDVRSLHVAGTAARA